MKKKVFDDPVQGQEAAEWLLALPQASQSVAAFALEFRILSAESGWNDLALLKDELATRDKSDNLPMCLDPLTPFKSLNFTV